MKPGTAMPGEGDCCATQPFLAPVLCSATNDNFCANKNKGEPVGAAVFVLKITLKEGTDERAGNGYSVVLLYSLLTQ